MRALGDMGCARAPSGLGSPRRGVSRGTRGVLARPCVCWILGHYSPRSYHRVEANPTTSPHLSNQMNHPRVPRGLSYRVLMDGTPRTKDPS
eukprot:4145258-Prymnesium_polylepis.2